MDLDVIRELIRLMKENRLTEIEIDSAGEHIRLRGESMPSGHVVAYPAPTAAPHQIAPPESVAAAAPTLPIVEIPGTVLIKSPIVGTYYHAPAPDKPPFVQVGDTIDENSVLCVIEAMKVMNEIKAETHGIVREILVQNGQPVEFGQPLFAIEPIP